MRRFDWMLFVFYIFFGLTILSGSFLLFEIQPMIGKYILPFFGGAAAVWITAMLFFQIFLLFGYSFVFVLSFLSLRVQLLIQGILVVVSFWILGAGFESGRISIFQDFGNNLFFADLPQFSVLFILFFSIGLPYFVLSTTSVVLQKWFGLVYKTHSPYIFYAVSNFSALIALLGYPFMIERLLPLRTQGYWWSVFYLVYAFLFLICIFLVFFRSKIVVPSAERFLLMSKRFAKIGKTGLAWWIFLPFLSTLMLLAVTTVLTQSVSPVPFLWVLPLSIYIVSYILAFAGRKFYFRNLYLILSLIGSFIGLVFVLGYMPNLIITIFVYSAMLFAICMLCHGELYAIRPKIEALDIYYLCIALGGAIAGVFVSLIAPILFGGIWEIYIGFYFVFMLCLFLVLKYKIVFLRNFLFYFMRSEKEIIVFWSITYPLAVVLTLFFLSFLSGADLTRIKTMRNFYGILSVKHKRFPAGEVVFLSHGNIIHGAEYMGKLASEPITYYDRKSGVGLLIGDYQKKYINLNIGIVGLGAGTMAAYGRDGDAITFYEINPQVVDIAKKDFKYLSLSKAKIRVVVGDGRRELQKDMQRNMPKYDIFVLDAFSDDAIPLHLLTKEAMSLYLNRLNEHGMIALHISNRYLNLEPVVQALAKHFVLNYGFVLVKETEFGTPSEWAFLMRDRGFLENFERSGILFRKDVKKPELWTDNYSNLLMILK